MLKKLLAIILLAVPAFVHAAVAITPPNAGGTGTAPATTAPTTCTVGSIFFDTDATAGSNLYGCTAANTWTAQGSSALTVGTTTIGSGTTTRILYDNAGVLGEAANLLIGTTAGDGISVVAGTAATNARRALSMSQTWTDGTTGNIGIVGNFDMGATGTATGKLISLQAGTAGTTEVFNISEKGSISSTINGSPTNAFTIDSGGVILNMTASGSLLTIPFGGITTNSSITITSASYPFRWAASTEILAPTNGNLLVWNTAGNDFGRLQFGGTTSSFPSLKRSSTSLAVRLADDSADAAITMSGLTASGTGVIMSGLGSATGTPSSACFNGTTMTVNAALTCTVSSARFKDRIEDLSKSGLVMVVRMTARTFYMKDRPDRQRIGLIAEELAAVDPRLAEYDKEGRPNSIDFAALFAVLIKAVFELAIIVMVGGTFLLLAVAYVAFRPARV